ncbi:MAG: S1 RNA-binding domain-containing protein [Candidatus Saccharibacteria bacterium]|jgi:small subunit ribosomal protein S1|nr:S1 RNA-binding domain-containing protein [Candidatus Saccharibacteria bacterium]
MNIMSKNTMSMDELLASTEVAELKIGDVIEGTITSVRKHEVWLDLGPNGVGVVMRREIGYGQKLEEGEKVTTSVVDPEMDEGYALLSMKRAVKDKGWDELQRVFDDQEIIEIVAYDANRGGMLVELEGIRGFLPVSQLAAGHYPRVSGADKDEILQKLGSLINKPIRVRILDVSRKDNKLIFSEKEAVKDDMQASFAKLKIGDEVEGVVTGVIDFGAFVNVDGIEGLVHISEISWERVENPRDYVKVGENITAKIIAIDKDRLSLSLKQMQEDPWLQEAKAFKVGDDVEGKVTRITPFGAFVQLGPAVEALVHVSEMSDEEGVDPEKIFELNQVKKFKIIDVDTDSRKIALSLKTKSEAKPKAKAKDESAEDAEVKAEKPKAKAAKK